jgi:AraC-like DNA-binding protein
MSVIEAALRGGAVALFILLGVIRLRDAHRAPADYFGGVFALGVAAYAISSSPGFNPVRLPWLIPIALLSMGNPAIFWPYAAATFDDDFKPSWRHGLCWLASVGLGAWCAFGGQGLACLAFDLLSLVFVALAIWHALAGRAIDLVEGRRRFRVTLVVFAALYTAAIIVSELVSRGHGSHAEPMHVVPQGFPASTINAFGLLAIGLLVGLARLSQRPWGAQATAPMSVTPQRRGGRDEPPAADEEADEQETALLAALDRLMTEQKAYREEGLSVAALAAKLDLPDYRLRRLINQRLGHHNFSTFVNGFRLADAMGALADPGQDAVPILTIALDAGFQSIGPFNRAFRAETGMTPSEFRRARIGRGESTDAS